jgi:hypothetical protein
LSFIDCFCTSYTCNHWRRQTWEQSPSRRTASASAGAALRELASSAI